MLAGLGTDRLIGGTVAVVAGSVQAIVLVVYLFFALVYFLFRSYKPAIDATLELWPFAVVRLTLFVIVSALALFMVIHIALQVTGNVS